MLTLSSLLLRPVKLFQDVRYEYIDLALAFLSATLPLFISKSIFGVDKCVVGLDNRKNDRPSHNKSQYLCLKSTLLLHGQDVKATLHMIAMIVK